MKRVFVLLAGVVAANAVVLAAAHVYAEVVVPGWKKGPLIDPAAPYHPANAIPLFAAAVCGALDLYLFVLVLWRRRRRPAWWVPWVALGVGVCGAEVGLRLWLARTQLTYFRPHPTLHWQVRPDLVDFANLSGGGAITTNADGMRNVTVPREKAADEFRILVLGDSSNFGHGVQNHEVWSWQLESLLGSAVPGRRIEVLNGACPGWTTYQAVEFMHETGLAYHPDLVVAGFNNDPGPDYFGDKARVPTGFVRAADTVLFRFETYLLAREFVLSTVRRYAPEPDVHYTASRAGEKPTYGKLGTEEAAGLVPRVPKDEFLANLETLQADGAREGYRFVWLNMPINRQEPDLVQRYVDPAYRTAAADLAAHDGFPLLDVDDRWQRTREPELHIIGHVFHPSAKGHRRFAEQVAAFLASGHLLPGEVAPPAIAGPPPAATEPTLRLGDTAAPAGAADWLDVHLYPTAVAAWADAQSGALDAFFVPRDDAARWLAGRTDVRLVAARGDELLALSVPWATRDPARGSRLLAVLGLTALPDLRAAPAAVAQPRFTDPGLVHGHVLELRFSASAQFNPGYAGPGAPAPKPTF